MKTKNCFKVLFGNEEFKRMNIPYKILWILISPWVFAYGFILGVIDSFIYAIRNF